MCFVSAMDVKSLAWAALPQEMLDRSQAPWCDVVFVCVCVCVLSPWMSKSLPGQPCPLICFITAKHPATTLFRCDFITMDVKIFAWAALPTKMLDRGQAPDAVAV